MPTEFEWKEHQAFERWSNHLNKCKHCFNAPNERKYFCLKGQVLHDVWCRLDAEKKRRWRAANAT